MVNPFSASFLVSNFCKIALRFICNTYIDNLFTDQGIVEKMNDVDIFIKFIKFRDKYMKNPNNNQI